MKLKKIHGNKGRKRPDVSLRQRGKNNVAKRLEVRKKISEKAKGKVPINRKSFPKGNQYWRLRKQRNKEKEIIPFKNRVSHRKGISMEEEYGIKKANNIKKKNKKSHEGLKYSEETNKKKGRSGKLNVMKRPKIKEKHLIACRTYGKQWKGGKSFEPYTKEFDLKFKRMIRKRDNYICTKCGKHQEKEKKSLTVHHIDYNKELSILQNCCALCNRCNSEVNWNRKHWIKFFQSILAEKYGYKYSESNEIIMEVR